MIIDGQEISPSRLEEVAMLPDVVITRTESGVSKTLHASKEERKVILDKLFRYVVFPEDPIEKVTEERTVRREALLYDYNAVADHTHLVPLVPGSVKVSTRNAELTATDDGSGFLSGSLIGMADNREEENINYEIGNVIFEAPDSEHLEGENRVFITYDYEAHYYTDHQGNELNLINSAHPDYRRILENQRRINQLEELLLNEFGEEMLNHYID